MATLFLRSLVCDEPLTSNGDDIEVFLLGTSIGGQFGIDQGQSKDLAQLALALDPEELSFDAGDTVTIEFKEDSDSCTVSSPLEAGDQSGLRINVVTAGTPTQMIPFTLIKGGNRDGRYRLFYKWRQA